MMYRQPRAKPSGPGETNDVYDEVCAVDRVGVQTNRNPSYQVREQNVPDATDAVTSTKPKPMGYFIAGFLILSLLALSLIAVVIYSAQVRSLSQDNVASLQAEVQQLKSQLERLQVIQGANFTVNQLTAMQEQLEQQARFQTSATSELASVQSLVQTLSRVQTNVLDDLSTLRTVNLYQGCIEHTRSCTTSLSSSTYYWRSCQTSGLSVDNTGYYTIGMRCEYERNYGYFESTVIWRSGSTVYCLCDVTYPFTTSNGHNSLSTSFTATCTLKITRCPLQQNLLI